MGTRRVKGLKKKKEEEKKEVVKEKKVKKKVIEGVRGIVRIAEIDLAGEKKIRNALLGVKGIGKSLARGISIAAGLSPETMIGSLSDDQIKKLEDVIRNPMKYGIPYHMLNRRHDTSTGEHKHLVASDLRFSVKSDIDFMRKIRSYKGIRHESGLPVRGQRTRTSFRAGKTVGVAKKKEMRKAARKEAPKATGTKEKKEEVKESK
jgi:small subunit ribosomal protein S13